MYAYMRRIVAGCGEWYRDYSTLIILSRVGMPTSVFIYEKTCCWVWRVVEGLLYSNHIIKSASLHHHSQGQDAIAHSKINIVYI